MDLHIHVALTLLSKATLSSIERVHHTGDSRVLGSAPAPRFPPESNFVSADSTHKSFGLNYKPMSNVYLHNKKDHICTLKIMKSMSEFGGLWKHQDNPACTKSVSLQTVEVGH